MRQMVPHTSHHYTCLRGDLHAHQYRRTFPSSQIDATVQQTRHGQTRDPRCTKKLSSVFRLHNMDATNRKQPHLSIMAFVVRTKA